MSLFPAPTREHGGALSIGRRRRRRTLSTREPLHLTLRSESAHGRRSLLLHKAIIIAVLKKAERLFRVKTYRFAICGNHLHFLVRGKTRVELQNFFRVLAGHIAQNILWHCPLTPAELKESQAQQRGCKKNRRKFWALLIYSRILTWGREFTRVADYILQNTLEALNKIAYQPRHKARAGPGQMPPKFSKKID